MKVKLARYLDPFEIRNDIKGLTDLFLKVSVIFFVVVAQTFSASGLMRPAALLLFIALAAQGPMRVVKAAGKFPTEIILLNMWLLWAAFTGVFVSASMGLFIDNVESVTLIVVLVNLFYLLISYDINIFRYIMFAVLLSALIHYVAMALGYVSAEEAYLKGRAQGLANNPNTLGVRAVYSAIPLLMTIPTLFLWKNKKSILSFFLLSLLMSLIIATASRKSAIAFIILLTGFVAIHMGNSKKGVNYIKIMLIGAFMAVLLQFVIPIIIEGTIMQERFVDLEESGGVTEDIRYTMVMFGLELFYENPIFGVGLDNYRYHAPFHMYSHNDYIESLACTGGVGFVLYQLFWVFILIRAGKLLHKAEDRENRFYIGMIAIGVITIKIVALGQILYQQPAGMIILATFSAATWVLDKKVKNKEIRL